MSFWTFSGKKKPSPETKKTQHTWMHEEKSWEGPVCKFNFGTFSGGSPRISWNHANESWPISRDSGQNWALNFYWSCNTTLLKERLHASTFVVCWRKCLIEIKTFFQQKMLNKRHQTCMLHVLTLLIQQMFYNNVWACSRGFKGLLYLDKTSSISPFGRYSPTPSAFRATCFSWRNCVSGLMMMTTISNKGPRWHYCNTPHSLWLCGVK